MVEREIGFKTYFSFWYWFIAIYKDITFLLKITQRIVLFRKMRWCLYTNWITRVRPLWKFVCTHRCNYETTVTSLEKEQFIAYIYILETFPTRHFKFFKIIFNALSSMWVPINVEQPCYCDVRLCGEQKEYV